MTQITIQCRLVASKQTRKLLWKLMAKKNTPLINKIFWEINNHPEVNQWQSEGKLPKALVSKLCKSLKEDSLYTGQPSRFYQSATTLVSYIYKSWLKLQQRKQRQLKGNEKWLSMLKSDTELLKESDCSLDILRSEAKDILRDVETKIDQLEKSKTREQTQKIPKKSSLLFDLYNKTEEKNTFLRSAICYLLKNGSKLPQPDKPEDQKKFAQCRRKVEIKIERLKEQLESSLPHGRDLTEKQWLKTLQTAAITIPQNSAESRAWQDILLAKPKPLPFPIIFETNEDLKWHKNNRGRLNVRFCGLSKHTFKIYCGRRQLHWFQRFLKDQQIKKESKDAHSSGLFTLRSAKLAWQEDKNKNTGKPWDDNRLILFCTLDTRFWSAEGTQIARIEKEAKLIEIIDSMKEKEKLTANQEAFVARKHTTLSKLHNSFPRPSRILYQGKSNIILSVVMGLDKPASVAIFNVNTGNKIAIRSTKQLLGKNYRLLNRQRKQKQVLSHLRHKAQKSSINNQRGESNLGEYVDRLIAKAIVELAKRYRVSVIAVPKIKDIREIVQSEIKVKAEAKIPGYEEGQKKYAKQYRINIHNWSYGRLIKNITIQADKLGITISEVKQPVRGSPIEKAEIMATGKSGEA